MYLKLTINGPEPQYTLIECHKVEFRTGCEGGNGWAEADGVTYPLTGPAYILNDLGRMIDSFSPPRCDGEVSFDTPQPDCRTLNANVDRLIGAMERLHAEARPRSSRL